MGLFDGLFDGLGELMNNIGEAVNDVVGNDYREIYFEHNPGITHYCKRCGKVLRKGDSDLTIDHIVPQKWGGTNAITNLQPLCRKCNSWKHAKIDDLTLKYSGAALIREIKNLI